MSRDFGRRGGGGYCSLYEPFLGGVLGGFRILVRDLGGLRGERVVFREGKHL